MKSPRWPALLVFVVAVATMGRLCTHDFVDWDDRFTIYANPRLNPPTWENLKFYWQNAEYGLWMPGTYTVWSALAWATRLEQPDERGSRLNPWVFHSFNVVLHALSAVVVYMLVKRLLRVHVSHLRSDEPHRTATRRRGEVAALLGALVFAVHPVQVETVGWISGGKDLLCGLFTLGALHAYVSAAQSERHRLARYMLATLWFMIALICKPAAMVAPALVFVIDFVALRRPLKQVMGWTAAWWLLALAAAVIAKFVQPGTGIETAPWYYRPLVATDALAFYIVKLIWPARLAVDYGRAPTLALRQHWIFWTWVVPLITAGAIGWIWTRGRSLMESESPPAIYHLAPTGALFFVVALAPTLGFTAFLFQYYSTVADHYLYTAMAGVSILAACIVMIFRHRWLTIVLWVVIVLLAVRSVLQAAVWQNDQTLFAHVLSVNPDSFLAYHNLASPIYNDAIRLKRAARIGEQYGAREPAEAAGIRSRQLLERSAELYRQSIAAYERARGKDEYFDGHLNLGYAYIELGQPDLALAEHQRAWQILTGRPEVLRKQAPALKRAIGRDLFELRRYGESLNWMNDALRDEPNNAEYQREREDVLQSLQQNPTTQLAP
ncbi:MAG TPA: tetratricopeptide repeat protein [Tepidisphaeraceae bacterium]|jgi:hypothetical protein